MKHTVVVLLWSIVIGVLFFSAFYILVSGVTSYFLYPGRENILNSMKTCRPAWVDAGLFSVDEVCLKNCRDVFKVTNYKIEKLKCFCDINNCNPGE